MYNPFSLEGKTILVTGASSGIGQATAIECSKMGATIIITGRNAERLQETFNLLEGNGHQQIVADLANQEGIDVLIASLPKLEGAVLCAGISVVLPIQFATREKFDKVFDINFFSQVEILRIIYKKKILNKEGSIVLISSIAGKISSPGNGMYGASKAALVRLSKYAAFEFATRKIRVNCISPGMTETPLVGKTPLTDEQYADYTERIPFKRFAKPIEVAQTAVFLLSDASVYITGQDIAVDGGATR